jgi:amidase
MDEITYWSATKLARAIRAKQLSSLEVVEAHLRRIAEVNPKLNAIVRLTAETACEQARQADADLARGEIRGPLHGVPFTVKDSIATAGVITTAGTVGRASFVPSQDATVVTRMYNAGAILLGKTNCAELCASGETDNQVYGRTSNPYDLTRSPGGSSGGEVAIIAAGGSPVGLGSDFGGSIRGPAHLCGIAGLNPTMGRVPRTGHIPPYGGAFDTARIGPLARFVEDLGLTLPIIAGMDWIDPTVVPMPLGNPRAVDLPSLRVAFYTDNDFFLATPDTVDVIRNTARVLAEAGISVTEDHPDCLAEIMMIATQVQSVDKNAQQQGIWAELTEPVEMHPAAIRSHAEMWLQRSRNAPASGAMSAPELLVWTKKWDICKSAMLDFMRRYDVILCPVDPYPAMPHGFMLQKEFNPLGLTSYTKPYSMAGWPSATVRAGSSAEGLPIGVQVVAGPWREDVASAIAQYIETTLGGWQPPKL